MRRAVVYQAETGPMGEGTTWDGSRAMENLTTEMRRLCPASWAEAVSASSVHQQHLPQDHHVFITAGPITVRDGPPRLDGQPSQTVTMVCGLQNCGPWAIIAHSAFTHLPPTASRRSRSRSQVNHVQMRGDNSAVTSSASVDDVPPLRSGRGPPVIAHKR